MHQAKFDFVTYREISFALSAQFSEHLKCYLPGVRSDQGNFVNFHSALLEKHTSGRAAAAFISQKNYLQNRIRLSSIIPKLIEIQIR